MDFSIVEKILKFAQVFDEGAPFTEREDFPITERDPSDEPPPSVLEEEESTKVMPGAQEGHELKFADTTSEEDQDTVRAGFDRLMSLDEQYDKSIDPRFIDYTRTLITHIGKSTDLERINSFVEAWGKIGEDIIADALMVRLSEAGFKDPFDNPMPPRDEDYEDYEYSDFEDIDFEDEEGLEESSSSEEDEYGPKTLRSRVAKFKLYSDVFARLARG